MLLVECAHRKASARSECCAHAAGTSLSCRLLIEYVCIEQKHIMRGYGFADFHHQYQGCHVLEPNTRMLDTYVRAPPMPLHRALKDPGEGAVLSRCAPMQPRAGPHTPRGRAARLSRARPVL
eukprot:7051871-Prymnesium_polylepis.1